ncbi:hypothetical protein MMC12_005621 [Toensbergia leucococca]|nr:hypothetical protein [Toensbergia leucococca]
MSSLGKITNSLFSAVNENSLSLASVKFDFSLVKIEAPLEFTAVGTALSSKRRHAAEEGLPHKTARKLGALFEQLIPSTPKLITAYGLRVSEILQSPTVNPQGSASHGPFESFVGADGTAMWAAATSGIPALGIYLLSCLLARAWDAKESTSIWVELVAGRRKEIEQASMENYLVSDASLVSSRQDISRHELALWDASTRAWLRSADQAKAWEQNQLMLILKNIEIPFNGGPSTYVKVVKAWQQAMIAIENMLCGRPLAISNGSVLLALSAWHLFPDLIVLRQDTINVKFNDPLVPQNGIGTIGLQLVPPKNIKGIQWSLSLSHLQYYGGPADVKSNTDFSRVTIHQLHVITLGSIFGAWELRPGDILPAAKWFEELWTFLKRAGCGQHDISLRNRFGWLYNLVQAARTLRILEAQGNPDGLNLLKFGQRRAASFLWQSTGSLWSFFGLCNPCVLAGLTEKYDVECGIRYLREIAMTTGLKANDSIIRFVHITPPGKSLGCIEFATAIPHPRASKKRDSDGNHIVEMVHARWLQVVQIGKSTELTDLQTPVIDEHSAAEYIKSRICELRDRGEECTLVRSKTFGDKDHFEWTNPPPLYCPRSRSADAIQDSVSADGCPSLTNNDNNCCCFDTDRENSSKAEKKHLSHFCPIVGGSPLGLYVQRKEHSQVTGKSCPIPASQDRAHIVMRAVVRPTETIQWSTNASISWGRMVDYLQCLAGVGKEEVMMQKKYAIGMTLLAGARRFPQPWIWSLHGIDLASQVYHNLDGATISLKLVAAPLHNASWLPGQLVSYETPSTQHSLLSATEAPILRTWIHKTLDRPQTFACIAKFESGDLDLDPLDLKFTLALCSENSIYVAGVVLSDPFDVVPEHKMRRIVGNIGHSGICMLIAPQHPQIRPLSDKYNIVTHATYDSKREDNFKSTSLHLSFTDWTLPLEVEGMRTIDQEVSFVESVISVLDNGVWVADLDILGIDFQHLERENRFRKLGQCTVKHDETPMYDYTSLDSWEELLDGPKGVGIFRAHGNWAARLAAVTILSQKDQMYCLGIFGPEKPCFKCLESQLKDPGFGLNEFESPLPSFCID